MVCWASSLCCIVNECVNVSRVNWFSHVYFRGVHHSHKTWWICSQMAFVCVFLILVGLRFMLYELHNVSKWNLNLELLSYIKYQHLGYLHNQILLTDWLMWSDDLLKISSLNIFYFQLTILVYSFKNNGSSTISNQLDAVFIMVRAMKFITEPSLSFTAYRSTNLMHTASHEVLTTTLDGKNSHLLIRLLFTWQVLHDFVID